MKRGEPVLRGTPEQRVNLRAFAAQHGIDIETLEVWGNDRYSAHVRRDDEGNVRHISYHRRDRKPIRDWRDAQRIKNDIAGPEAEGLELYPAESRVVDTSNEYHIWIVPEGVLQYVGFREGLVLDADDSNDLPVVQRPLKGEQ
jgi:hypothetical protein